MRWRLTAALTVAVCALAATTVDDSPAWAARDDAQENVRSALENARVAVDTLVAGYEAELEACRTALTEARTEIASLQRNLDEAKTRIAELEARVAELRKWLRRPAAEVPPLGIFCGAVSEEVLAEFTADENVEPFIIMTNWCFDPGPPEGGCGIVDLERLAGFVEQMMPDPCGEYWVCFDAEHIYTDRIKEVEIGSPKFQENLDQIEAGLKLIKCMRCNARMTCWGWPLTSWQAKVGGVWVPWNNPDTSEVKQATFERWKACEQVWRHFDWWTPSAYDRYPREHFHNWFQDMHRAAVVYRQQLCQRLNGEIPIITSVWPRSSGYPDGKLHVLPCDEIASHQVDAALGAGAAGVVWWGAPKFYYREGAISEDEIKPGRPWDEVRDHFDNVHRENFDCLLHAALGLDPHAQRPIPKPIDPDPGDSD